MRVIEIGINGDQWLGPHSVKLLYDITNATALPNPENPESQPEAFTNILGPVSAGSWTCLGGCVL